MNKTLGTLNIIVGLLAIAYSIHLGLFLRANSAFAVIDYSNTYSKVTEAYEVARIYSNLRFFTVLTIGLSGIFFGYKAVEIKAFQRAPLIIHWTFFASSMALDLLTVVGILSDIGLKV